jgi:hypothetical protein
MNAIIADTSPYDGPVPATAFEAGVLDLELAWVDPVQLKLEPAKRSAPRILIAEHASSEALRMES